MKIQAIKSNISRAGRSIFVDADTIAREAGSTKTYNVVMLGAASPFIGIEKEQLEVGIQKLFQGKGQELIDLNITAFRKGLESSLN